MDNDAKAGETGRQGGHWAFKPEGKKNALAANGQEKAGSQPQDTLENGAGDENAVTWTASEYVAHHKGFGWYLLVVLAGVVLAALVYLISRDIISTVAIVLVALIFAAAAGRKPRVLTYRLDASGLTIGDKFYPYGNFKSFALVEQGVLTNITFMPLKRFMPSLTVYFAPEDQQKILDALSQHLPMEQSRGELVDRLMHHIRF
jgi:hypothetical protein